MDVLRLVPRASAICPHPPAALALLLALAGAFVLPAHAQRLAIQRYTTADGLPHDDVVVISQDLRGFLWFGTAEGLTRFDGYRFATLGPAHGLPNPWVTDTLEEQDGGRWVATRGGVVHLGRSGKPTRTYSIGQTQGSNRVMDLYRDRRGRIWAGTQDGVFMLPSQQAEFVRVGRSAVAAGDFWVTAFAEDEHGTLWISTNSGLMSWRDGGPMDELAWRRLGIKPDWGPLLADGEGRIWGGGAHGLWCLRPSAEAEGAAAPRRLDVPLLAETRIRLPDVPGEICRYRAGGGPDQITALLRTRDGVLWIGTRRQGLLTIGAQGFRRYTRGQGLIDDSVSSLFEDRDENLWVGAPSGLMRMQRGGFTSYGAAEGLVDPHIIAIVADRQDRPCALGRDGVLQCLRGDSLRSVRPRVPGSFGRMGQNQILARDHDGAWWMRAETGLYQFPSADPLAALAQAPRRFGRHTGLPVDHASRVFVDSRGDLWVGFWDRGRNTIARRGARTGAFEWLATPESWAPRRVPYAFAEDAAGNVWIGFAEGGLARYRRGRLDLVEGPHPDRALVSHVRALHVDAKGRLWFAASQDGLGRIDDPDAERPTLRRYGRREGLSSDTVLCVTEDSWGRIYAGTQRGVDRLDPASGLVRRFTAADGLAPGDVEACTWSAGRLWFGTSSGLSAFRPRLEPKTEAPAVYIQGMHVAGEPRETSPSGETEVAGLELPFPGHLQIEFASVGFGSGSGARYQYRLEGADRGWSPLTDERSVNYASLNPGRYRFEVRAVSAEGLMSAAPATVAFRVIPPWWRQPWFLAVAAALVVLAAAAAVRYRVAVLLEIERVRTRIASDLHDDVGSTVSRMAILSEVAKRQVEATHGDAAHVLDEIAASARGLLDTTGDIVWAIDPRRDHGANLAARVREFGAGLLEAKGIAWEFAASPEAEALRFDPEQRRQLLLLFKEGLHNVVRHSRCAAAGVRIDVRDGRLVAEIRDDGRGFAVGAAPSGTGHGLDSMRARAARLGGKLRIQSEVGAGTRLLLEVPVRRRHA